MSKTMKNLGLLTFCFLVTMSLFFLYFQSGVEVNIKQTTEELPDLSPEKVLHNSLKVEKEFSKSINANFTDPNFIFHQTHFTIDEMKNFVQNEVKEIRALLSDPKTAEKRLQRLDYMADEFINGIKYQLSRWEGLQDLRSQRVKIWRKLSDTVQSRINKLQNKKDCQKLHFCKLDNDAGFASGIHDLLWCQISAFYLGRRLILDSSQWHYTHNRKNEWDFYFLPMSNITDCKDHKPENVKIHMSNPFHDKHRLTDLPIELANDMLQLARDPLPWFYGQFLGYALRPSEQLRSGLERAKVGIGYDHPIVGIHIRRTDKLIREGAYHSCSEYMRHVNQFYKRLQMDGKSVATKRVFIATDDPKAIKECKEDFPDYTFLYNNATASESVNNLHYRFHKGALWNVMLDLYLLAESDYFVGTFSSGFGRLAYELMQYQQPDALNNFHSLDTELYVAIVQNFPVKKAIFEHKPSWSTEIAISPGDLLQKNASEYYERIAAAGKLNDGFVKMTNLGTNAKGMVPMFKTIPIFSQDSITQSETEPQNKTTN